MKLDINTQHGYDILTAMRGPDTDNAFHKMLFTSVIRYFALEFDKREPQLSGKSWEFNVHGAIVNSPEWVRERVAQKSGPAGYADAELPCESYHFLHHAKMAFIALDSEFPEARLRKYWNWALREAKVTQSYLTLSTF